MSPDLKALQDDIQGDIRSAVAPMLTLSEEDVAALTADLVALVRGHSAVPDQDPRLSALLAKIPSFVSRLRLSLDPRYGLTVRSTSEDDVALYLERGTRWLRSVDWKRVVTARVSRGTITSPTTSSPQS